MADAMEIIISAVDQASSVFGDIISSAQDMASDIVGSVGSASSEFDTISNNVSEFQSAVDNIDSTELEALASTLGMDTDEVERLLQAGADIGSLSAGFNEAASAADELEKEIQEDTEAMQEFGSAGDVMAAQTFMDVANGMKDAMLGAADTAGTFNDSIMRASLEAEGAGVNVEQMKNIVSELSDTTGRAGGQIREAFIKATARGVTDMDSFKTMMEGAGAQATLLGTDIETMGNKFSGMAQKDTLMARALAETGITMDELGTAMGMTGATADEVKEKWKELDTNQRAAILGTAASMNEGKNANSEYKNSWAGLQEQVNIAKGRLERIVGSVLLPVLIPAMKLAGDILNGVGDVIQGVMNGPLGGLVSVLGAAGGAFLIAVTGAAALRSMFAFLRLNTMLDSAATIFNTGTKILNGEASGAGAIANSLLGTSFMESAAAAWAAAAGFLAAAWPLLVIVGVIAVVVVAIYELGKAFGWWTDISSMFDAIRAGVMRLWDAFINHPDVQAVIQALGEVWNWLASGIGWVIDQVMNFFNISTGGEFDIVHALIMAIGQAWNFITAPIRAVISAVQNVIGAFDQFRNGQMDLPTFIMTILQNLLNVYMSIFGRIIVLVVQWGSRIFSSAVRAVTRFVTGIVTRVRQLPGRVYSALLLVVSRITSAIQSWINAGVRKVHDLISKITSPFSGVAGKISSALGGVADAFTKPFRDAWSWIKPYYDKIKGALDIIPSFGGEPAYGGESALDVVTGQSFRINTGEYIVDEDNSPVVIEDNINLTLDLRNVPSNVNTSQLIEALGDKRVLSALTSNRDFQDLDAKVKQKIALKNVRSRGR